MSEWISVEERLPGPETCWPILVVNLDDYGDKLVTTMFHLDARLARKFRVTHWMPLPEPPSS